MLTVQWRIKREQAQTIYEKYGGDVQNVRDRLGSLVMERTKSSLSQYTAEDLISQRSALSVSIETLIVEEINGRGMPVEIVAIYLTDFAFSDAFEAAVEAKMIADQQRLKAETEKQIAIIQAEQQLATTILEAESALEEAKGEANAILAIAQAEAAALSAKVVDVARTLGMPVTSTTDPVTEVTTYTVDTSGSTPEELKVIFDYIQYIEYLNTWNGELPQVITDGSGIIINP
jgi:regulator of protease activity HflC (stomatin/prohibitin superfamily)